MKIWISTCLLAIGAAAALAGQDANQQAEQLGERSPLVKSAARMLVKNIKGIHDETIREATLDAIRNPLTCIAHRANLGEAAKAAILEKLKEEGLLDAADGAAKDGIFPPVKNDGGACPQLPLRIYGAPGSGWHGHHSYPGGLAVHEVFNQRSAMELAADYRAVFGKDLPINESWVIAAPAWHDWAKTMVFQWKPNGETLDEFNFGGNGKTDNGGAAGDSRTGAHHILGLAETMARGLPPGLVITQASAHAAPTLGNEYKVINWLRAAAIVARVDPAAKGYLVIDKNGHWRLPPLEHLWDGVDLQRAGQVNFLIEYQIHNLSDADFVESIPAAGQAELILSTVAKEFGYDPADESTYNWKFRHAVLAALGPERIATLYASYGLERVKQEIQALKTKRLL